MAIVGEAHIIVRAITTKVDSDIRRGFAGSNRSAQDAGKNVAQRFKDGFNSNMSGNVFGKIRSGLGAAFSDAESKAQAFHAAMRKAFAMQAGIGSLIGGISSLIGALGALIGSAGQAGASLVVMGNGLFAAVSAMAVAKSAFKGIGAAISAYGKQQGAGAKAATDNSAAREAAARRVQQAEQALARVIESNREQLTAANNQVRESQLALNRAIIQGQESLQQLGFDAEDAALGERRAALSLQDALTRLRGVQDLPPNDAARQEAELSYQEAELAYRRAKDHNADISKEQTAAAQKGVAGTQEVIDAQKNLQDAEDARSKTVRDNARQEQDAADNLRDARKAAADAAKPPASSGGGAKDPFAGLTAAQKTFALFLIGLQPKFRALREAAANSLLPPLQDAISLLMRRDGLYGTVLAGVPIIGRAMGAASMSIARALNDPKTLGNIQQLFGSSGILIRNFGAGLGNYIRAFSTILRAAIPLAERFSGWLLQQSKNFNDFINQADKGGKLTDFFNQAGDTMAKFGTIFGNLFSGLGAIIRANMGPGSGGQMLLDFFIQGTSGLRDLNTAAGQLKLRQYFIETATNAKPILSLIRQIVGAFLDLGRDQNIGKTFTILQGGVGPLKAIAKAGIDSGPAFATLVVSVAKLLAIFAGDAGAPNAFFTTLNGIVSTVVDFVSQPAVKNFINWFGTITATISAFTFAAILLSSAFSVVIGSVMLFLKPLQMLLEIGKIVGMLKEFAIFTRIAAAAQAAFNFVLALNPIVLIVIAIGLLIAALVLFFTQTKEGKIAWQEFCRFLQEAWDNAVNFLQVAIDNLVNYFQGMWAVITAGVQTFVAVFQGYFNVLVAYWNGFWSIFGAIIQGAWELIVGYITNYLTVIWTTIQAALTFIITYWQSIWNGLVTAVTGVWNAIQTFIQVAITNVQSIIQNVLGLIVAIFTGQWDKIPRYLEGIFQGIVNIVQGYFTMVRGIIGSILNGIRVAWNGVWGGIRTFFFTVWNAIQKAVGNMAGIMGRAFGRVATAIHDAWDSVLGAVRGTINNLITIANNAIDSLNRLSFSVPKIFPPPFGGQTIGLHIPHIPRLAMGGVVNPSVGGSLVNVAEAGRAERIEPLDPSGLSARDRAMIAKLAPAGGGMTFNIHAAPGMNVQELAEAVSREVAYRIRKGSI